MREISKRVVIVVGFLVAHSINAGALHPVGLDDLLKNPQRWAGSKVSVTGYYHIAGHSSYLCRDAKAATEEEGTEKIFIDLPESISDSKAKSAADRLVRITGTFQYRKRRK